MTALYVQYPDWISPFVIDGLPVRWYAVMYLVAFAITYALFSYECKHDGVIRMDSEERQSFFLTAIIMLLAGARLFSVLFYSDASYYLTHPWMIFWPFRNGQFIGLPGMSYHGGVVGALIGGWIYAVRNKRSLLQLADLTCAAIPLGYTFGRLGNFFNAELYGRVTTGPFGMIFPGAERFSSDIPWVREVADKIGMEWMSGEMLNLPRHPSQLYEALFEGIILFLILWFIVRPIKIRKKLAHGTILAAYLFGYGFFRFFIEYCRQPDADIGYVISLGNGSGTTALFTSFLNISKGQIFCLLMMLSAVVLECIIMRRNKNGHNLESAGIKKKTGGKRH